MVVAGVRTVAVLVVGLARAAVGAVEVTVVGGSPLLQHVFERLPLSSTQDNLSM